MPLEDDLKRIVDAAVADLTDLVRRESDQARQDALAHGRAEALAEGREQARAEALEQGRQQGLAEALEQGRQQQQGLAEAREQGREQGRAEARREAEQAAEQQTRIAVDAAVAAVRADRSSDLAASERLLEAIRAIDTGRSLSEILDTLAGCAGREAARVGLVLVRGTRLRGWRFVGFADLDSRATLDVPLADAGVIAEAVRTKASASGETGAHAGPPPFAQLQAGRESLAIPLVMAGEVVAALYADQGNREEPAAPAEPTGFAVEPPAWPERLEILTRHAARCLEALTALKAARVVAEPPDADESRASADDRGRSELEEAQASARRYAKLLISEIKLYHEAAVVAGRRERDLATRLGGEIARARTLYEQRVPMAIRQRGDYFFEELVRTLANGDASLLQLT